MSIKSKMSRYALLASFAMVAFTACKKDKGGELGDLTAPANVTVVAEPAGKDASHPNGDGTGVVNISVTSDYALGYKVDYDSTDAPAWSVIPRGTGTHKYITPGLHTYTITVVVAGKGGVTTTVYTTVTVQSDFEPDPVIVTDLTADASKTWYVDKDVPGHLGVGPYDAGSIRPEWWAAGVNEKVACCNCFYTARYTFTKTGANAYSLAVSTPDGAFTKTGALTSLPGIPATGAEACYPYSGGTSNFSFAPASSGAPIVGQNGNFGSTQTSIVLNGPNANTTFIGYGATLKEYEILSITPNAMQLRVQGTETSNAWYIKLKSD